MDTVAEIEARITAKQADYEATAAKLADVTARLIDATDGQRAKLLQERMMIVADRDALQDELRELKRRYALAAIAPYEQAEADAAAFVTVCAERATKARIALGEAMEQQRVWQSIDRRKLTQEDGDREAAEWAGKLAKLRAESQIAADATRHARYLRDKAHNETAAMRQHLGIG